MREKPYRTIPAGALNGHAVQHVTNHGVKTLPASIPVRGEFTVQHGERTYTMRTGNPVLPDQVDMFPEEQRARLIYPPEPDGRIAVLVCQIEGDTLVPDQQAMYRPVGNGEFVREGAE